MKTHIRKIAGFVGAFAFALVVAQPVSADEDTIADIAVAADDLSTLVALATEAELAGAIANPEANLTVFAPTNDAFAKIPEVMVNKLLERTDILADIILYHVSGEELFAADVLASKKIDTLQGETLKPKLKGDTAYVNKSQIIATDIDASNGVVHLIDTVLIPKESARELRMSIIEDFKAEIKAIQMKLNNLEN